MNALLFVHDQSKHSCDFILCESLNRVPIITTIKDGEIKTGLEHAWIGSQRAFACFQNAFHSISSESPVYCKLRSAFQIVIDNPKIDEVGHFHTEAYLDHNICDAQQDSVFLYEFKSQVDTGSQTFHIEADTPTALTTGEATFGAYGTCYFRSISTKRHAIAVYLPHGKLGVLMCPQIDCEKPTLLEAPSASVFLENIWLKYKIGMEGFDVSENNFQLLRNYPNS